MLHRCVSFVCLSLLSVNTYIDAPGGSRLRNSVTETSDNTGGAVHAIVSGYTATFALSIYLRLLFVVRWKQD